MTHKLNLEGIDLTFDADLDMVKDIHEGSEGESVVEIQKLLGIEETGVFDEDTMDAVIMFQIENDLCPDGFVGPMTFGRMKRLLT